MSHYFSHVRLRDRMDLSAERCSLVYPGDAYKDHALIWRLFPGDDAKRDFVFRRLEDPKAFYVVSAREPDGSSGLFEIRTKKYHPDLSMGESIHFDLRANPVVSRRTPDGRSVRHDVLMDARRLHEQSDKRCDARALKDAMDKAGKAWLLQRAGVWGLEVLDDSIMQSAYSQHDLNRKRSRGNREKSIRFSSLDYQGVAIVTDPELLRQALLNGVGHAKGFGCGLLLIRRQR